MSVSDALEIAGLAVFTAAAFLVSITVGLAIAGLSLLLVGFALDRKGDE